MYFLILYVKAKIVLFFAWLTYDPLEMKTAMDRVFYMSTLMIALAGLAMTEDLALFSEENCGVDGTTNLGCTDIAANTCCFGPSQLWDSGEVAEVGGSETVVLDLYSIQAGNACAVLLDSTTFENTGTATAKKCLSVSTPLSVAGAKWFLGDLTRRAEEGEPVAARWFKRDGNKVYSSNHTEKRLAIADINLQMESGL